MVEEKSLEIAVHNAWSVFRTRHCEVDASDRRRWLLERHLQRIRIAQDGAAEELTGSGIAYLELLPEHEC